MRARDPQISIFMVGANDDQGIDVNGTSVSPPDPAWIEEYRRRVDTLMTSMTAGGRQLIWIGMPPMRAPSTRSRCSWSTRCSRRSRPSTGG